jgi:hypothetical protein
MLIFARGKKSITNGEVYNVHQQSRTRGSDPRFHRWTTSQKYGCLPEVDKQDFIFENIHLENRFIQWALKQFLFEEIRRIDLIWEIVKKFALNV